jgi:hypothetical protein
MPADTHYWDAAAVTLDRMTDSALGIGEVKATRQRTARKPTKFKNGLRVRLNASFPYGGRGREGTVVRRYGNILRVIFDDKPGQTILYHMGYFDVIEVAEKS